MVIQLQTNTPYFYELSGTFSTFYRKIHLSPRCKVLSTHIRPKAILLSNPINFFNLSIYV